jgi:hypothetical protein
MASMAWIDLRLAVSMTDRMLGLERHDDGATRPQNPDDRRLGDSVRFDHVGKHP